MVFSDLVKSILLESARPQTINLKIGNKQLITGIPGVVYDSIDEAPLSTATRRNLNILTKQQNGVYGKVYVVDRSGGRGAKSFYIEGKFNNEDIVYARIETAARQAGQTKVYYANKPAIQASKLIKTENTVIPVTDIDGKIIYRKTENRTKSIEYFKDPKCTILHRYGGPAIGGHLYVNGVYYLNKTTFKALRDIHLKKLDINKLKVVDSDGSIIYKVSDSKDTFYYKDSKFTISHRLSGPAKFEDGRYVYYIDNTAMYKFDEYEKQNKFFKMSDFIEDDICGTRVFKIPEYFEVCYYSDYDDKILHRFSGPANEFAGHTGDKHFIYGKFVTPEVHSVIRQNILDTGKIDLDQINSIISMTGI